MLPDEGHDTTRLYFPADQHQFAACVKRIFNDPGLRFLFSTRSAVPDILKDDGSPVFGPNYVFTPGKDDASKLEYGKSITDACLSWGDSLEVLEVLSKAVEARRAG